MKSTMESNYCESSDVSGVEDAFRCAVTDGGRSEQQHSAGRQLMDLSVCLIKSPVTGQLSSQSVDNLLRAVVDVVVFASS